MSNPSDPRKHTIRFDRFARAAQVIVVGSVMFTFISYWRTAAIVLCDLASTAYYIGGIVEQAIGPAAPWFILAVMLFSYAVRWVYIESCTLFVRGGVYRVVREALGAFPAKLAVSALMFDYILTGPISGVSAGQYIVGLGLASLKEFAPAYAVTDEATRKLLTNWGSVCIAVAVTLYFYRENIRGIHESSDKALKIMIITTIMAVVILLWCGTTLLFMDRPANPVPLAPDLSMKMEVKDGGEVPKLNPITQEQENPLGFLEYVLPWAEQLHAPARWFSVVGIMGLFIAFGHSILAMSGEETLAQVYREVESPKLPNFKKAAFIVFVYSLVLTAGISFLAVLIIPRDLRTGEYQDNLIGGLAMSVIGPKWALLLLNGFVTVVGFLILSGAVNTSIIGSNGVLNRVAEDGVLPDWFLKPHPRYGTTYRVLTLIVALQLFTIIASQGNIYLLGEAYAFGVIWSFVFQSFSMLVLRFKDKRPREYKVPGNLRIGGIDLPIGLGLIFLILVVTALFNLLTKEVATVGGLVFSSVFFGIFYFSERYHEQRRRGAHHEHLEQFNQQTAEAVSREGLGLTKPFRKLVAIRSPQNLFMLEKSLAETDPETTDVIVMTAKNIVADAPAAIPTEDLDRYDQELMTAVVNVAERAGKEVHPLIVPTNNPLYAVIRTARELRAQELIVGASNLFNADEQLDQLALYWMSLPGDEPVPVTVRILSRDRDVSLDLNGGNRIPKVSEKAHTVAELRAAGVGIDRVMLVYDASPDGRDLFQGVLTMLDPLVGLTVVPLSSDTTHDPVAFKQDQDRARHLGRSLEVLEVTGDRGPEIVRLARTGQYDLIILALPGERPPGRNVPLPEWTDYVLRHAHCRVCLAVPPAIPEEVVDQRG